MLQTPSARRRGVVGLGKRRGQHDLLGFHVNTQRHEQDHNERRFHNPYFVFNQLLTAVRSDVDNLFV